MDTYRNHYSPIADYALIGDCKTTALISRNGSIDWLCLPYFSSPSFFGAILDHQRAGRFAVQPRDRYTSHRYYEENTNILHTVFVTATGKMQIIDFMPIISETQKNTGLSPQNQLTRIIEILEGEVAIQIIFEPKPDYGRRRARLVKRGRLGWSTECDNFFFLGTDIPLQLSTDQAAVNGEIVLKAGEKRYLTLAYAKSDIGIIPLLGKNCEKELADTRTWWQAWCTRCSYVGPYRELVIRSALTLKLLTHALSGAVVAAPTTSLPEWIGGVRNWDYRYCWLRDASLTLHAFMDIGFLDEATAFIDWLLYTTRLTWPKLQVLYDVFGETKLTEMELSHWEGYRGSKPVRIGNEASKQLQLDVYGEVILAAAAFVACGGQLTRQEKRMLSGFGQTICNLWRQPDQGIWEMRDIPRHHTHSKVMAWAALDRIIALQEQGHLNIDKHCYLKEKQEIRDAIERHAFNWEYNSYVDVFDGTNADASLLIMPRVGYIAADHPQMVSTFQRIDKELGQQALIYRYRPATDNIPGKEGAFGICGFWAVDYLARAGRIDEARQRFEKLLSYANDLGLYSEEINPHTGEMLGNFPQAFTHIGLITAATTLAKMEQNYKQEAMNYEFKHQRYAY